MAEKQLSAQERALLFAQATRQNIHNVPVHSGIGGDTIQFTLPKSRLLSKIMFRVDATVNIKHASKTTVPTDIFTPFRIIRKLSLDMNNGFSPFVITGEEACRLNMVAKDPTLFEASETNPGAYVYCPKLAASTTGKDNSYSYNFELPITINPRDPIGLILLQNDQTVCTLNMDIDSGNNFINEDGYTTDIKSVKVTTAIETFSLPAVAQAFPDLSVLKLCTGRNDPFLANSQAIVKLETGQIYRKIILYFKDENGLAMEDTDINSNIELCFNGADINYSIRPESMRAMNTQMYGKPLPKGMFVLDFASMQGAVNLAGTRDYIDTEKLTELTLRFTATKRGILSIVSEKISRLRG